ncbi:MAG: TlpA family protein disulfide reductase [Planctomycetota bacterium]|jgi:thiol-disulfide isomerase/thioredoxin
MRTRTFLSIAACLMLTTGAFAQRGQLKVGDAAPSLDIAEWVKGSATTIETGNVYVVEFWATWCGPCRKSIPHLTKLQEEYGADGLTIIGVSDEEPDVVKPFVQRQGGNMDYTVAVDRRDGTKRNWFQAAGLKGIPAAFIVDRHRKVAFIGNPLDPTFDQVLGLVMGGRYNPKLEREAAPVIKAARSARKVRNWRMAMKHYDEVIEKDKWVFSRVAIERFEMMLLDMSDRDAAYAYAREELLDKHFIDDAGALADLGENIASNPDISDDLRDLPFALELAETSVELSSGDPRSLSTLAAIQFHSGDTAAAVATQRRAWKLVRPKDKEQYRRVLRTYQEAAQRAAIR